MEIFTELTHHLASEISSKENRSRKRSVEAQHHFEYAIETILKDLWKATFLSPEYECGINKRTAYYSESPRYRDPMTK